MEEHENIRNERNDSRGRLSWDRDDLLLAGCKNEEVGRSLSDFLVIHISDVARGCPTSTRGEHGTAETQDDHDAQDFGSQRSAYGTIRGGPVDLLPGGGSDRQLPGRRRFSHDR